MSRPAGKLPLITVWGNLQKGGGGNKFNITPHQSYVITSEIMSRLRSIQTQNHSGYERDVMLRHIYLYNFKVPDGMSRTLTRYNGEHEVM